MPAFRRMLLFLAFSALCVFADSHARIVRLSFVNGDVQMDRGTGNGYETAILNMPVVYQSHLRTGDDSEAEIEFENGSTFRLTPNSEISFSELSLTDAGDHITHIRLDHGLAYVEWKRSDGAGADFQVESNGHIISLKKSSHLRLTADDQQTIIALFNGEANVSGPGNVDVKGGETLTLDNTEGDRYFLARNIDSGAFDAWDKDRDTARTAVAAHQQTQYVSDSAYYGPDLGYYGSWIDSSYGSVWRPNYVGSAWNPYGAGSWAWYPTWGWQWVSAYPWGFVPYHYGSWVYVNGYGYCWRRPNHWHGWNNATLVASGPGRSTGIIAPNGTRDTGIIAANGTHGTGTLPMNNLVPPPPAPFRGAGATLITVGNPANIEVRDPVVRTGRNGQERIIPAQSFRGGTGANGAVATNPLLPPRTIAPSGNVEVHMARPDRTVTPVITPVPGTIATQDSNPKQRPGEAPDRLDTPRTNHTPMHRVPPPDDIHTTPVPATTARPVVVPTPAAATHSAPTPAPAPVRIAPPPPAVVHSAPAPIHISPAPVRGGGEYHPAAPMGGAGSRGAAAGTGSPRNPR